MNNPLQPLTPAALYARVSSDRQDIGPVRRRTAEGAPGLRRDERLGSDYGQKCGRCRTPTGDLTNVNRSHQPAELNPPAWPATAESTLARRPWRPVGCM